MDDSKIRPVVGYEERFLVTEDGQLISNKSKKVLSQTPNHKGYLTHATKIGGRNGQNVCLRINRLVAEAFIPNPENKPEVNHVNGIKTDNHKDNLEWSTEQENTIHAFKTGLIVRKTGSEAYTAKLNDEQVMQINSMHGQHTSRTVGEMYGVSHVTIVRIWNNQR